MGFGSRKMGVKVFGCFGEEGKQEVLWTKLVFALGDFVSKQSANGTAWWFWAIGILRGTSIRIPNHRAQNQFTITHLKFNDIAPEKLAGPKRKVRLVFKPSWLSGAGCWTLGR